MMLKVGRTMVGNSGIDGLYLNFLSESLISFLLELDAINSPSSGNRLLPFHSCNVWDSAVSIYTFPMARLHPEVLANDWHARHQSIVSSKPFKNPNKVPTKPMLLWISAMMKSIIYHRPKKAHSFWWQYQGAGLSRDYIQKPSEPALFSSEVFSYFSQWNSGTFWYCWKSLWYQWCYKRTGAPGGTPPSVWLPG